MSKRLVIIGGSAAGASAAARARRLDEHAEIIMLEKGSFVSYANCGLPYHIGNVIKNRQALLVQTPESLKKRLNIDVRIRHEVVHIDARKKEVTVRDHDGNREYTLAYDKLILAPGAEAFKPPIAGIDSKRIFTLKTIPDMDAIISHINLQKPTHAVVIGGGFIGIETAENLHHRGIAVTLVELDKQILPPFDPEMATPLHRHLMLNGVDLRLGKALTAIEDTPNKLVLHLNDGTTIETDMAVLAIGVRPESKLAQEAGLAINARGAIITDKRLCTSDPDIFAAGDAIETFDGITKMPTSLQLAGPANRQGRIAADNAMSDMKSEYRGVIGTWIVKIFDMTAAQTGLSEKRLKLLKKPFTKTYIHPTDHASYYPDAKPMSIKLLFDPENGAVLGAQIVGSAGVDKRIDVLATAVSGGMTVEDLSHLELAYAPPYSSAKDPINVAGMVGSNMMQGLCKPIFVEELSALNNQEHLLLHVGTAVEHEVRHIPGSLLIPLDELRHRLNELPKDKEIIAYCQAGLRAYFAQRILTQHGFNARNLVGGLKTWLLYNDDFTDIKPAAQIAETSESRTARTSDESILELDVCGLQCPGPLMKLSERIGELVVGQRINVIATDPGFLPDAEAWCKNSGNKLIEKRAENGRYSVIIEKTGGFTSLRNANLPMLRGKKRLTMIVFSGDFDRAYASFIIANGAVAMGLEVTMFFTFWGLTILRKRDTEVSTSKNTLETLFSIMMPRGAESLGLSKMNFAGIGTALMKRAMEQKNVTPLPELISSAQKSGVKMIACSMTMNIMGIKHEELLDGIGEGGVAAYLDSAADSTINLFI